MGSLGKEAGKGLGGKRTIHRAQFKLSVNGVLVPSPSALVRRRAFHQMPPIEAAIMFGLGSRQKLQMAQQALQFYEQVPEPWIYQLQWQNRSSQFLAERCS
jgi:hypothetical protein